jgi:hypothetical protein
MKNGWTWKEVVLVYFRVLSQHSSREIEDFIVNLLYNRGLFKIYCGHQMSCELSARGEKGRFCARINIHSKKHKLFRYLYTSSHEW